MGSMKPPLAILKDTLIAVLPHLVNDFWHQALLGHDHCKGRRGGGGGIIITTAAWVRQVSRQGNQLLHVARSSNGNMLATDWSVGEGGGAEVAAALGRSVLAC